MKFLNENEKRLYERTVNRFSPWTHYPEELAKMDAELSVWHSRYSRYSQEIIILAKKGEFDAIPEVADKLNEAERMEKEIGAARKEPARLYWKWRQKK